MNKNIEDLKHIRSMMERSSKFLSLSGFSVIGAGLIALTGAFIAWLVMTGEIVIIGNVLYDLLLLAMLVLLAASTCGLYFSIRKARKHNTKFWMPVTIQILKDFSIPLFSGGFFCFIMFLHGSVGFIAPSMLIFYGLALVAAGARTYEEVRILGICEIILGLLAAVFIYKGLLFWTLGFGVLHIIYGVTIYWRYDRKPLKGQAQ